MKNLLKKELSYYLNSPLGYIVIILFAAFANLFYVKDIFITGSASLRPFFFLMPWFFLVFIPALAMRIFSEEKRNNTLEILLTLPYSETQIVLGKFLALFFLLFLSLILTLSLPISLFFLAKIYLPEVLVAYLGCWLLGSAFITLTMFFSVKTKNQVVAFLTSAILIFFLLILGTDFSASFLPRFLQDFLSYFSPFYHFQNFVKGVFDGRSFFYFVSFIFLFLFLTVIDLEKKE